MRFKKLLLKKSSFSCSLNATKYYRFHLSKIGLINKKEEESLLILPLFYNWQPRDLPLW